MHYVVTAEDCRSVLPHSAKRCTRCACVDVNESVQGVSICNAMSWHVFVNRVTSCCLCWGRSLLAFDCENIRQPPDHCHGALTCTQWYCPAVFCHRVEKQLEHFATTAAAFWHICAYTAIACCHYICNVLLLKRDFTMNNCDANWLPQLRYFGSCS